MDSCKQEGYNFAKGYMMTLNLIVPGVVIDYDVKWSYQPRGNGKAIKVIAYKPSGVKGYTKRSRELTENELPEYLNGVKEYRSTL